MNSCEIVISGYSLNSSGNYKYADVDSEKYYRFMD